MLHSILLHLEGADLSRSVIDFGVMLARQRQLRIRGVTIADTREIESLVSTCESAGHAEIEHRRLLHTEIEQRGVHAGFSQACLTADVNFDVRKLSGDPLNLLAGEAQCHDLTVMSYSANPKAFSSSPTHRFKVGDYVDLLHRGVQPLLILRGDPSALNRVLLVHDGTNESGRAIRSYLAQSLFRHADHRLLAVGEDETQARKNLREMVEYCRDVQDTPYEAGVFCGRLRKALVTYLQKWQADVVVLGMPRGARLFSRLFKNAVHDVLQRSTSSLFVTS